MIIKKFQFGFCVAILLTLMALLLYVSNTPYQKQNIKPFLERTLHLTPESFPKMDFHFSGTLVTTERPYEFLEFIVRKGSHMIEYMVLTIILLFLLTSTRIPTLYSILVSFGFSFLFACVDELHQSFADGRTGQFIDVYTFDLIGMLIAIAIFLLVEEIKNGKNHSLKSVNNNK